MSNIVKFTMSNMPAGLDSMYARVEEDAVTNGVRNVLYAGVTPVSGNAIEIDIGNNGTVGNGVIVSADNYTSGGAAFKYMYGHGVIEAGEVSNLSFDNIVFLGSSTSARAFNSPERLAEMQEILSEHGLPAMNLVTEVQSGSAAGYQADTLMPQAVSNNASLQNVLFFCQSPGNSIGEAYSTASQNTKDSLQSSIESILNQANSAGWTTLYSNFNKTPNKDTFEIEQWNDVFLAPIVESLAPDSISSGVYVQDYEKLGGLSNYLLSSVDGIHLAETCGDRLYRQYSAANIARYMGYDTRKDLSGRRVVVKPASSDISSWARIQNITPLGRGANTTPYKHMGANLVDADTGEILTDLYVVLDGAAASATGRGNTGDSSSSYLNDTVLKENAWVGIGTFYLEIGSFTQQLPDIASLKLAGSSITEGDDRIGEWICNGETKYLDGTETPCGLVDFLNVPTVDNKVTATSTAAAGSVRSYLSAIEIQFA